MLQRDPTKLFPHDYLMRFTLVPLVPKYITPNMITWFRFVTIPFIIIFLSLDNYAVSIFLFLLAALSDALDGSLARLRHQITAWGTFYDPLADKLLVGTVILVVVIQHVNPILGFLILFIDGLILIGGYIRRRQGKPMGSNIFGKTKMFFQILGVGFLLIALWAGFDLFIPLSTGALALAIVLAVISLFTYGI